MLRILDNNSITRLKEAIDQNHRLITDHEFVSKNTDYTREYSHFVFEPPEVELDPSKTGEGDSKNALIVYESLPGLLPCDAASNHNLWITLTFDAFPQYACERWYNPESFIESHWFGMKSREVHRDQAISRLWWYAHITKDLDGITQSEALKIIENSNVRGSTIERPGIFRSKESLSAIFRVIRDHDKEGVPAELIKQVAVEIFRRASRTRFESMPTVDQVDIFSPIYAFYYGEYEKLGAKRFKEKYR